MTATDAKFHYEAREVAVKMMGSTASSIVRPAEPEDGVSPDGVAPADVVRFLARLRLLEGVPFSYLVPDSNLLPTESIRFFHLDRNWTDALVQGALAVGTVNSADRAKLEQLYGIVRAETDTAERLVRMKDADRPAIDAEGRPIGAGGDITGFLLRSRVVSGWPGLHVRAYASDTRPDNETIPDMDTSPDRVRVLRMERLAPAVLLVLFDGVPAVVHLEEPRAGIQFGVRLAPSASGRVRAVTTLRDVDRPNAGPLPDPADPGEPKQEPVPFRRNAPGVINLAALEQTLVSDVRTNLDGEMDAADLAIEMLRFPIRQVFGDVDGGTDVDAFRPTRSIDRVTADYRRGVDHVKERIGR